jgi:hypothetical protein
MGHGATFGCALWAIAKNQLAPAQNYATFLKACHILERESDAKKVYACKKYY